MAFYKIKSNHFVILTIYFMTLLLKGFPSSNIPEPDIFIHEVMDETISDLSKKYTLIPCGIGMNGKFEYLEISFQIKKKLTQDELRLILLDCTETFLKKINSCEKIKPFLKNFPFTHKNTGIVLYLRDTDNSDIHHPYICCAYTHGNEIFYHTKSKEDRFNYKKTSEESYDEACFLADKNYEKNLLKN